MSVCPNRVSEDVSGEVSVRDCMALKADGHHIAVVGLEAERLGHKDVPVRSSALLVDTWSLFIHISTGLLSCVVYKQGITGRGIEYTR